MSSSRDRWAAVVERAAAAAPAGPLPDGLAEDLLACLDAAAGPVRRAASDELARLAPAEPRIEARLRERLDAPEARRRQAAAFTLARLGGRAARLVPVLIETLGDPVSETRWSAHHALALLREPRAGVLAALLEAARAGGPMQRRMALYAVRACGAAEGAVAELVIGGLADPDTHVRLAALALASHAERVPAAARDAVLGVLADDAVLGVRRAATAALARLALRGADGPWLERVRDALERAARDPDARMRKAAHAALRALAAAPAR